MNYVELCFYQWQETVNLCVAEIYCIIDIARVELVFVSVLYFKRVETSYALRNYSDLTVLVCISMLRVHVHRWFVLWPVKHRYSEGFPPDRERKWEYLSAWDLWSNRRQEFWRSLFIFLLFFVIIYFLFSASSEIPSSSTVNTAARFSPTSHIIKIYHLARQFLKWVNVNSCPMGKSIGQWCVLSSSPSLLELDLGKIPGFSISVVDWFGRVTDSWPISSL